MGTLKNFTALYSEKRWLIYIWRNSMSFFQCTMSVYCLKWHDNVCEILSTAILPQMKAVAVSSWSSPFGLDSELSVLKRKVKTEQFKEHLHVPMFIWDNHDTCTDFLICCFSTNLIALYYIIRPFCLKSNILVYYQFCCLGYRQSGYIGTMVIGYILTFWDYSWGPHCWLYVSI